MKKILMRWLLKDQELRNLALREVIGDAEVKQVNATDIDNLEIHDCILFQSYISKCKSANIQRNTFDSCTIKEIVWKSDDNVF